MNIVLVREYIFIVLFVHWKYIKDLLFFFQFGNSSQSLPTCYLTNFSLGLIIRKLKNLSLLKARKKKLSPCPNR